MTSEVCTSTNMTQVENIPQPDPQYKPLYDILNQSGNNNTQYSTEYRRRTAFQVSKLIYDTGESLRIPDEVQQTAAEYYVTASENDLIKGASQEAMTGAALRAASIGHEDPRPLGHLAEELDERTKTIRTKLSQLMQIVDIDYVPVSADAYIDFITEELNIDTDHAAAECAIDILEQKRDNDETFFYSKSPIAVAAGAMYAALRINSIVGVGQREVANACHVSTVSIRTHYKPLLKTYDQ